MTRQETVLSLWSTFPISQAYGTFLRFEAFAGRSGRVMDGRRGSRRLVAWGTILLLSPAIIDLWATYRERELGRPPLILGYQKEDRQSNKN